MIPSEMLPREPHSTIQEGVLCSFAGRTSNIPLYEEVAARITDLIERGTFAPGSRIPSVRQLSHQLHVSVSTVIGAYRRLEDQGRIEARPQSGYYVCLHTPSRSKPSGPLAEPETSRPALDPMPVRAGQLTMRIMRHHHDPSLVPLGAAVPNPALLPLEKLNRALTRAMRQAGESGHVYDTPPGCEALRVQIARRLLSAGCTLAPDQIVTTAGSQEAIGLCLRAVCRPGDTVAIESPIYYGILQAIEMQGLKALEIPTHPRSGISLEALDQALAQNEVKACVVIPNYSNPIGSLMPDESKQRLVEMLAARNIPLIEDDVYGDLGFGPARSKVCKAWDQTGNVLLCSSFSKTLSPGYRVGWVAPGRWQNEIVNQKLVASLATPLPTQLAVAEFLASGGYDHHLRRVRRVHAQQTAQMAQAVAHFFPENTRVTRPVGGYVLWVEMPPQTDSLRLFEEALALGISLAPGPMFSACGRYRSFVRLNTAFWSSEVEAALEKLGRLVEQQLRYQGGKNG